MQSSRGSKTVEEKEKEKEKEKDAEKAKLKSSKVEPAKPHVIDASNVDDWDESLLPPELIEEVWKEQISPPHSSESSEEPYDFVTDSGTAITLFRKKKAKKGHYGSDVPDVTEEEEEEVVQVPSLPDVDGGIPKATLKKMKIEEIEESLLELEDAMNFVLAENIIFERTIGRMEQRDREIEAAMPIFTYKYPWETENDSDKGGSDGEDSSESSCDDDSKDSTASRYGEMKNTTEDELFESNEDGGGEDDGGEDDGGEEEGDEFRKDRRKKRKRKKVKNTNPMIGPDGKIRELCEWKDSDDDEFTGDFEGIQPSKEISVSRDRFFEGIPIQDKYAIRNYIRTFGEIAPANYDYMRHKYHKLIKDTYQTTEVVANEKLEDNYDDEVREHQKIFDEVEGLGDEDADFPGFFPRSAKRLPLEHKYKYAEEEDEILAKDITAEQTKSYRKENAIQVLIDTNVDVFELLSTLNEEFTEILKHAYHPLTKKLKVEKILQFRKAIRSKILADETKITMSLVELQKVRKKVNEQLRTQQAGCFQILKEQRQKLNKKIRLHARMVDDIGLRETLMIAFQADLQKYTQILNEVQQRNNFMRKRIRAFKVPNSMEYIRFKAILAELEEEVTSMRKRLRSLELSKGTKQLNLETLAKGLPKETVHEFYKTFKKNDNEEWLEEMKRHVNEKGLLSILTEDELNNVHTEKEAKRQLGETKALKNYLLITRKDSKGKGKRFVPAPKHVRDLYDPEDDQKSNPDVSKFQNNRSRQKRQTFNRLYENKPKAKKVIQATTKENTKTPKCGDRFRRGVRGNINMDSRDQNELRNVAKC